MAVRKPKQNGCDEGKEILGGNGASKLRLGYINIQGLRLFLEQLCVV
jgi:hypothetical protein